MHKTGLRKAGWALLMNLTSVICLLIHWVKWEVLV